MSDIFGIMLDGPVRLPTKISKITVLKSPHIDKKSREQFEIRKHKAAFFLTFPSTVVFVLFKYLLRTKISGIFMKFTDVQCVNSSIG